MKNETIRKINLYFNAAICCAIIGAFLYYTYGELQFYYSANWDSALKEIGDYSINCFLALIPFALTFWWQKKAPLESTGNGFLFNIFVFCLYGFLFLIVSNAHGTDAGLAVFMYVACVVLLHVGSMILIGIAAFVVALVRRKSKDKP